jgi:hypothetical protein
MRPVILSLAYESKEAIAQKARSGTTLSTRRCRVLMFDPAPFLTRHKDVVRPAQEAFALARYVGLGCHVTRETEAGRKLSNPGDFMPRAFVLESPESSGTIVAEALWLRLPNILTPVDTDEVDDLMADVIYPTLDGLRLVPETFTGRSPLWPDLFDTRPDAEASRLTTLFGEVPVCHLTLQPSATPAVQLGAEKIMDTLLRRRGLAPRQASLLDEVRAMQGKLASASPASLLSRSHGW